MDEGSGDKQTRDGRSSTFPAPSCGDGPSTVFLSYASVDKAIADAVCAALESADIRCWIAPRDVTPGVFYADAIVEAINSARVMIVVLSASAAGSQHVLREVERASSKRKPLIAFRLDAAQLPPGLEYFLSASHWLDASLNPPERAYPQLLSAVRRLLEVRGAVAPSTDNGITAADGAASRSRSKRSLLIAAAASIAIVLAVAVTSWVSRRIAAEKSRRPAVIAAIPEKSIVVLPFTDMSEKHDQEYFAEGMAEEVSELLAKLNSLRVIGRSSAFQFKGRTQDPQTAGRDLGAAYVVHGSVRKSGDRLRIMAQLIQTTDGTQVWAETYEDSIGDVLKVQDRIASNVVRALQIATGAADGHAREVLKSPEAYALYLRGRHAIDRYEKEDLERAVDYFQQALDLDPSFIRAAEWLAITQESQAEVGFVSPLEGFERAKQSIERGLRLNPRSAALLSLRALIHAIYDWDWDAARSDSKLALSIDPHDSEVLLNSGLIYRGFGPLEEATRLLNAALAIDPLDSASHFYLGKVRYAAGRMAEAETEFRKFLDFSPNNSEAHFSIGLIRMDEGHLDQALTEMRAAGSDIGKAVVYRAMGKIAESNAALARQISSHANDDAAGIAQIYGYFGDADSTFFWLERAYRQKDVSIHVIKYLPLFDKVKTDPRYQAFLRKMNL